MKLEYKISVNSFKNLIKKEKSDKISICVYEK